MSLAMDARKAREQYARRAAVVREQVEKLRRDFKPDRAEPEVAALLQAQETAHAGLLQYLRGLVTQAIANEATQRPSAVQRRAAMTPAGAVQAANMRAVVAGAPMGELRAIADHAAATKDWATAHAIRAELLSRDLPASKDEADIMRDVIAKLNEGLSALHGLAIADVIGCQYVAAVADTNGPLDEWNATDPQTRLAAHYAANGFTNEQGERVTLKDDDAEAFRVQSGATDPATPDDPRREGMSPDRLQHWTLQGLWVPAKADVDQGAAQYERAPDQVPATV